MLKTENASATHGFAKERAELEVVLAARFCARAPNLAHLLRFVCERYFDGATEDLKEYTIAVEALGRPPEFDQKSDAIVRVEAHRLRKRLREYYESDGKDHEIHIELPLGAYVPRFVSHRSATAGSIAAVASNVPIDVPELVGNGHPDSKDVAAEAPPDVSSPLGTRDQPSHLPAVNMLPVKIQEPVIPVSTLGPGVLRWGIYASAAVLLGALGWWWVFGRQAPAGNAQSAPAVVASAPTSAPAEPAIRIAVGSSRPLVDHAGREWMADQYFTGGRVEASAGGPISFTRDADLYRSRREGEFRYDIPLEPGRYELWLHFAETVYGPSNPAGGAESSRIFDVLINGKPALESFDVLADAGAENKADIRVFGGVGPAEDGRLHIEFRNQKSGAILSGLELHPTPSTLMHPLRIRAFDNAFRTGKGAVWAADRFFQNGVIVSRASEIEGAPEPELYRGERYGNFVYEFPVAPGIYRIRLMFSERWFGPGKPGGGGPGSRIFDVYCNGTALLRDFDIYRAAGGPDRPVERVFAGIRSNSQGKIRLAFVPVTNYACVNAIEVIPEAVLADSRRRVSAGL